MKSQISNVNIEEIRPLFSPAEFKRGTPLDETLKEQIIGYREDIKKILRGEDDRLLAIVGPCSIHDPKAALDYANRLSVLKEKYKDRLYIVMRVYFEKPRTSIGWRGLITDPDMNDTDDIEKGLKVALELLLGINRMGLPVGSEILDPIIPQYIAELISWAAIGARTTESQTHRDIASGLSMPVGFKNGTDGSLIKAVNAIESAMHPHSFIGIDQYGMTSVIRTRGNGFGHLILRGGAHGPNYYEENIEEAEELLVKTGALPAVIVDCSHANSGKKYTRQERVLSSLIDQRRRGRDSIKGFMLESFIEPGAQKISKDLSCLVYGKSVTDECVGWAETEELLEAAWQGLDI
jgi:3-deoxy-7-phosphoheptulonate synthase